MLYVFLCCSVLGAVFLALARNWYAAASVLWRLPLTAIGFFIGLVLLYLLVVIVTTRFVNRRRLPEKPSAFFHFLLSQLCRIILPLAGVRIHISGLERLPHDRRFLLVSNHLFALDPLVYYYAIPSGELSFISKKENYSLFVVAEFLQALLCLPIDRENDRAALRTVLKAVELLKSDRTSFVIFPEGGTSKTGELQSFRNGAFKIAQKAEVPIVVCTVSDTRRIVKNMFRRRTDVYLDLLEVIEPQELKGVSTAEVGERVHRTMELSLDERKKQLA